MSNRRPQATFWSDSREGNHVHQEKVLRKLEKIQVLKALLEEWEARPDEVDHDYLLGLRARLRSAQNQLESMSI